MSKISANVRRMFAVVVAAATVGLAFAPPAMANSTVNNGTAVSSNNARAFDEVLGKGDMFQFRPNKLDATLSLPRRLECQRGQGSVTLNADNVAVLTWTCFRGEERRFAQVGRQRLNLDRGDELVVRDGRACVQSRWRHCGPRDWVPTWERDERRVHTFTLSGDSWRPGQQRLQVDVTTTGLLNRRSAFHAEQRGNTLTLGGGWRDRD